MVLSLDEQQCGGGGRSPRVALGAGAVEGTKHLFRAEVGVAVGFAATPQLARLLARLSRWAVGPGRPARGARRQIRRTAACPVNPKASHRARPAVS